MNHIACFFWLAEESWSALRYYWPITLALVAAVVVTSIFNFPFARSRFHHRYLLVLLPLGVSLLILVWGSLMRNSGQHSVAPTWPSHVILGLLVAQFLTGIGVVCALKGYRWFSAAVVLLEQWVGVAFAFVAGMSVTGDWL
jgi:drug/metabolite transporter (DMT)-like permease